MIIWSLHDPRSLVHDQDGGPPGKVMEEMFAQFVVQEEPIWICGTNFLHLYLPVDVESCSNLTAMYRI